MCIRDSHSGEFAFDANHRRPEGPGEMIRPLKWFNEWSHSCMWPKDSFTCPHDLRSAWLSAAGSDPNVITHDSLSVDPECTKTSATAFHRDGTGLSVGISPGTLAETQSFEFVMYVGARATRAAAEAAIAELPDIKFWALAWAGAAADDGGPATFFYAFDVPLSAPPPSSFHCLRRPLQCALALFVSVPSGCLGI